MSSGAGLAAAQRRRAGGAGGAKGLPNQAVTKKSNKKPISIEELVVQHDKQIDYLRNQYLDNTEHWDQCDAFLKTIAENYDNVNRRLNEKGNDGSKNTNEGEELSSKIDDLTRNAATKDEVIGLITAMKDQILSQKELDEESEQTKKTNKLEAEITKLRSAIMLLQNEVSSDKAPVNKSIIKVNDNLSDN